MSDALQMLYGLEGILIASLTPQLPSRENLKGTRAMTAMGATLVVTLRLPNTLLQLDKHLSVRVTLFGLCLLLMLALQTWAGTHGHALLGRLGHHAEDFAHVSRLFGNSGDQD